MGNLIDINGKKFGKWLVLGDAPIRGKNTFVRCLCDCGVEKEVNKASLTHGRSKSCGCEYNVTHGYTTKGNIRTEYNAWDGMKKRCYSPTNRAYKYYGGRGIKVCDRWLNSFENFLADMGNKPTPEHTLERIRVNGNYTPSNCRWATMKEQGNNKRNTVRITFKGQTKTASEWAEEFGCKRMQIYGRYRSTGLKYFDRPFDSKNR